MLRKEERRNRGDLIEVFKMVKGWSDVSWQSFFQKCTNELTVCMTGSLPNRVVRRTVICISSPFEC